MRRPRPARAPALAPCQQCGAIAAIAASGAMLAGASHAATAAAIVWATVWTLVLAMLLATIWASAATRTATVAVSMPFVQ